jgi:hypothetical protein
MSRYLRLSLACLVFSLLSLSMMAQAPPSADSYVAKISPSTNYGSAPILAVQEGTTAYVQFDLSALPAGTSISKATMRLFVNNVVTPGTFDVYQVNDRWSESTLNYNNAPPLGASATGGNLINISASSLTQFIFVDITPLVRGWLTGAVPNNGVALALAGGPDANPGSFSFDSKENTLTGHAPELAMVQIGACPVVDRNVHPDNPTCKKIKSALLACCLCKDLDHCRNYDTNKDTDVDDLQEACDKYCKDGGCGDGGKVTTKAMCSSTLYPCK